MKKIQMELFGIGMYAVKYSSVPCGKNAFLITAGKAAVMRGPAVYCVESVDNGDYIRNIRLDSRGIIDVCDTAEFGIPTLTCEGYRRELPKDAPLYSEGLSSYKPIKVKLIPYFGFANRGASEMAVWNNIIF